jgi:hypothetical protein
VFQAALTNPRLALYDCYTANMWNSFSLFQDRVVDVPGAIGSIHKAVALCPTDAQLRANYVRMLLRYDDLKDAKGALQALRDLHDLRREAELAELQADYDRQARSQNRK